MRNHLIVSLVMLSMLLPGRAASTSYYVSEEGDDANPGTVYTNESWYSTSALLAIGTNVHVVYQDKWFNDIPPALAVATNGDLIHVYPGTYPGQIQVTVIRELRSTDYAR